MRLDEIHQTIKPYSRNIQTPDLDKVVHYIKRRCAPMIEIYRKTPNNYLYRGVKDEENLISIQKIHKERTAVTMQRDEIEFWHQAFIDFGLTATRKNSIFTSGISSVAQDWGLTCVVYPIGNFHYTWFDVVNVYSLGALNRGFSDAVVADGDEMPWKKEKSLKQYNELKKYAMAGVKACKPRIDHLEEGIKGRKEVLISCDRWVAVAREIHEEIAQDILN